MAVNPPSSFQEAIDKFKIRSGLSSKELFDMEVTSLYDLQRALATIQHEQQKTRTERFLKRLQPFLDTMEQYCKAMNIFANAHEIVAFIWGPLRFILLIASNFSEAFNALLEGYVAIGESIPQLAQYQEVFSKSHCMEISLSLIFEDILDFHLEAVKLFRQKIWKQLYQAMSRSLNTKIQYLTKSLQRHKSTIETQASLEGFKQFQDFRTAMLEDSRRSHEIEKDRQSIRVQHWLGSVNSNARHEDVVKQRFPGTGQWLIQDHRFQNWFSPDQCIDPLLWLHGIPGAGKTILASLVIDEACQIPNSIVLHFYCKHADGPKNGLLTVVKSFLSQLLPQNDSVLHYLYEEASKSSEAVLSTAAVAKRHLDIALKSCTRIYIVLDGLDEYGREDRKDLTTWFQRSVLSLSEAELGSMRCLFVSQEDGFARKDLSMLSQIKIMPADNRADIEAFCEEWHQKIEAKFGVLERREHHVKNVVSARSQGMFLFAKLVTWNLHEQTSRLDFEREIDPNNFPDGLDEAYDRIVNRLLGPAVKPQSRSVNIGRLLAWLACAKRPLKWYEIQSAITINLESGILDEKQQFREDCKDLCASLVEIHSDQSVTLVHSTTKGYLTRNKYIDIIEAEYAMATRCLVYLSMPEFEVEKQHVNIKENIFQGTYAFTDYAACFWAVHLENSIQESDSRNSDQMLFITECLEVFLDIYWMSSEKTYAVSTTLHEHMNALQHLEYFDRVCQAVSCAKHWLRPTSKSPSDDEGLRITRVTLKIRAEIEDIVSRSSNITGSEDLLVQLYGTNHYKCPRMNCQYFHQGFKTSMQREEHIAKHDRSYICLEGGCFYSIIGFTTAKELAKHKSDTHGIKADCDEPEFPKEVTAPNLPREEVTPPNLPRAPKQKKAFECHLCPKTFTRGYNLASHLLIHKGKRPFICSICPKAFTRHHDMKRHESLHDGEKEFICQGELKSPPGRWGCGRRFARAEALSNHFKSEVGRRCIEPLLQQTPSKHQATMESNTVQTAEAALPDIRARLGSHWSQDTSDTEKFKSLPPLLLSEGSSGEARLDSQRLSIE